MMKRLRYIFLGVLPLLLTGCVTWQDVVDTVATSWDTIVCWAISLLSAVIQALVDVDSTIMTTLASVLPTVALPTITFDSTFMSSIAYFVPISEVATVFVAVFSAVITYYGVMVVLRWLKVLK